MKYVKIPQPVEIKDPVTEKVVLTQDFASWITFMLNDPKFGEKAADIRTSLALEEKFKKADPGQLVKLSDEDWDKLNMVVEHPTAPYNPIVVRHLVAFLDAITEAADKEPIEE